MKIHLVKLELFGDRNRYKIEFKDGLNFITGPISTGKSTILEMVDYCLGKRRHKNYDEVRRTCKYVSLDLILNEKRILIERPLFSFELPVKIFQWKEESAEFDTDFDYFIVTQPKEDNSLAKFLAEMLEVPSIKLSGQTFSFRDIFKYCYVRQTEMDSENLLDEKNYAKAFKRKPTFEIILNCLNELLNELKNEKKEQDKLIGDLLDRKEAIIKFLRDAELFQVEGENEDRRAKLIIEKIEANDELKELKENGKLKTDDTRTLETNLFQQRRRIASYTNEEDELKKYVGKLVLLKNQYSNEIVKIDYLLLSNGKLKNVDFESCPSCNRQLDNRKNDKCNLCGQPLLEFDDDEEKAIRLERKRLSSRLHSLDEFIEGQEKELEGIEKAKKRRVIQAHRIEKKIDSIQSEYISPFIERIETLNRRIGELDKQIESLDIYSNVQQELLRISNRIQKKENKLHDLIKAIEDQDMQDFESVIAQLSKVFHKVLEKFSFPKLEGAYIDSRTYLPHVRNTKYDDIGSLGAVTLINIAYFLSILELSLDLKTSYHPKILMLDTIGKNLGTRESNVDEDDEFKDSKIFKSVLQYIVDFAKKYEDQVQVIVVNNDYTGIVSDDDIIAHFDGKGTGDHKYGLIDDLV